MTTGLLTYQGTIILWNERKHWGFIRRDDGESVFYHRDNAVFGLIPATGMRVAFEMAPGLSIDKKEQAVSLREVKS
jgi:cold shock CspA family protein